MQYDFLEGGSLAVKDGNSIIPIVNELRNNKKFEYIALTQDWHP